MAPVTVQHDPMAPVTRAGVGWQRGAMAPVTRAGAG
jgi:hypothetical protein